MPDAPAHPGIVGRKALQEPRDAGNEVRDAIARLHPGVGGWVGVDDFDRKLVRHAPDFDPRTYSKRTLLELMKARTRQTPSQHPEGLARADSGSRQGQRTGCTLLNARGPAHGRASSPDT